MISKYYKRKIVRVKREKPGRKISLRHQVV